MWGRYRERKRAPAEGIEHQTWVHQRVPANAVVDAALASIEDHRLGAMRQLQPLMDAATLHRPIRDLLLAQVERWELETANAAARTDCSEKELMDDFLRTQVGLDRLWVERWCDCNEVKKLFGEIRCGEPWDGWPVNYSYFYVTAKMQL
jgi:hypothetical protein